VNKFSINPDMLGLMVFLSRKSGPRNGQDGSIWFFREVHDQLEPKDIESHLVSICFDIIGYERSKSLAEIIGGKRKMTDDEERFFRDNGFLYGTKPLFPKAVIKKAKFNWKHVFSRM